MDWPRIAISCFHIVLAVTLVWQFKKIAKLPPSNIPLIRYFTGSEITAEEEKLECRNLPGKMSGKSLAKKADTLHPQFHRILVQVY